MKINIREKRHKKYSQDGQGEYNKRILKFSQLPSFFRQFYSPAARPPWRRTWFYVIVAILTFLTIVYLMYQFGRTGSAHELAEPSHYDE